MYILANFTVLCFQERQIDRQQYDGFPFGTAPSSISFSFSEVYRYRRAPILRGNGKIRENNTRSMPEIRALITLPVFMLRKLKFGLKMVYLPNCRLDHIIFTSLQAS